MARPPEPLPSESCDPSGWHYYSSCHPSAPLPHGDPDLCGKFLVLGMRGLPAAPGRLGQLDETWCRIAHAIASGQARMQSGACGIAESACAAAGAPRKAREAAG
jgi:hypothetical protein